jgi:ATP-dependent Clp protease ATP-binding subunit ClpA
MWQRFTERARRVILLGQEEAGKTNSPHVGTEHLLLGLMREAEGVGAQLLIKMGVTPERVRQEIAKEIERGHEPSSSEPKLTQRAKRVLELAAEEARLMRHNYIGTEHLLLALVREKEGTAGQVLRHLGLDLEKARQEVSAYLGRDEWATPTTPEPPLKPKWSRSEGEKDWVLRILPRLLPPELRELETALHHIQLDVASAVAKNDYETANLLHQRANYIEHRIEEFVDKWEAAMQESTIPTPDFMPNTVINLITQIEAALEALQNNDAEKLNEARANLNALKQQLHGDPEN